MGERGREVAESAMADYQELKASGSNDSDDWFEAANDLLKRCLVG